MKNILLLLPILTLMLHTIMPESHAQTQPPATYFCTWSVSDNACETDLKAFTENTCGDHYYPGGGCYNLSSDECFDHSSANPDAVPFACLIDPYDPPPPVDSTSSATPDDDSSGLRCGGNGINTAIGCIPINDIQPFAVFILAWSLGIAGGIFIILVVISSFYIITGSGNPRRLRGGKELLFSAIAGLILLIFSVMLLRIIGVNLLRLGL